VLQVLNRADGRFGAADVPLAEALAAQCALALSRARLTDALLQAERLRQEMELARAVQWASLPQALPGVPGYELHAVFSPADRTGGDTYDVAWSADGLLLVIGDAAGHGIAPALRVTQMQAMLRMALRLGAPLDTAFREVNDQLAGTGDDGRFVSAFIGLLDPATHTLRWLSGGHGPTLLLRADGRCERHRSTSFPMGAMPLRETPRPQALTLEPGDLLALLTDGVFETADAAGRLFGVDGAQRVLGAAPGRPVAATAAALEAALQAHAGGRGPEDDVTMLLLRRRPE
jgi:phosphoserine phosphatase